MSERIGSNSGHGGYPTRNPAAAAKLLAETRALSPLTALNDLRGWIDAVRGDASPDEKIRGEILSLILEASRAPVAARLAPFLARPTDKLAAHESDWNALNNYLTALADTLCASAALLLKEATTNASLHPVAAAGAARALYACRMLTKTRLVRYASVPPKVWRAAYAVHTDAEQAACAVLPVRMDAAHKTPTSATHELLRLLMLHASAPEMMSPEQIEVADRVVEELGAEFTLRPRGVADNPFCFDPGSESAPRRADAESPEPNIDLRYFGAGAGYDTLERLYRQASTARAAEVPALGKDIPLHVQVSTLRHLGLFWGSASRYTAPVHAPATGSLQVVRGYASVWQHLSSAGAGAGELTLAGDDDGPAPAAEAWTLKDSGGNELGAELPQPSSNAARPGDLLCITVNGEHACRLGLIRAMHAEPGRSLHANIAIVSRDPKALELIALVDKDEEVAYSAEASRQFAFHRVRAIILADGSDPSHKPNFMLSPKNWREDRTYELTWAGESRFLRSGRLLRRGDDYVRATFEWVEKSG